MPSLRQCKAIVTVAIGRRGSRQFPVQRVENYTLNQSVDTDADSFSVDIGDSDNELALCLERDNAVKVQLFVDNDKNVLVPIFNGIVDTVNRSEDMVLAMEGRDLPSSLAIDSDAFPGRWKHLRPKQWLEGRAHALGIGLTAVADMAPIASLVTDGSEKEWALWYRVARKRGMYVWSDNVGRLIVDKLGYALSASYKFGNPPKGQASSGWFGVEAVAQNSTKQGRIRKVLIYGENAKKGKAMVAQGIDTSISSWERQPLMIQTSTTDKTIADLKETADEEVFESIVGSQEIELTIRDTGVLIQQNRMGLINLPMLDIENELWFIVGVQREGGVDGLTQRVRLREKGFALTKRVPDAPKLQPDPATDKPISSIGGALKQVIGKDWPSGWIDSFVRATNEFGVPAGWDFSVFLGVLLSIASHEHGDGVPRNVRGSVNGAINGVQWVPFADFRGETESPNRTGGTRDQYNRTFANAQKNPYNPRYPNSEDAVGIMQLVTPGFKDWADEYGWDGKPKHDEYEGGRWNPDSNIRAGARAFLGKLKAVNANPLIPGSIWQGVAAYYGSTDAAANKDYAARVKKLYDSLYEGMVVGAVAATKALPPGSSETAVAIPGYGTLQLPKATPLEARKAISFCLARMGDAYKYGGSGPLYDCSSFVTKALSIGAAYLRLKFDEPKESPPHHGESTYTLFDKGAKVTRDNLLAGDLVFFRGTPPEHVGMYLTDGLFIHDPAPGKFVRVNSIGEDYYRENYTGARRYITWIARPG